MKIALTAILIAATAPAIAQQFEARGQLGSPSLIETSGIAVSRRDSNLLWGINDSGNAANLHAFSHDGTDRGFVSIERSRNLDWEDLASFRLDDAPYILIADTGDNRSGRSVSWLYIIEEPQPGADGSYSGSMPFLTRIPFRFEDGPRDCESVAVDVASDRILLVSKSDSPARLYELPLTLVQGIRRPLIARQIAAISTLPRPTLADFFDAPLLGPWQHQPTAIDLTDDGSVLGLLTFRSLYLFRRQPGQLWGDVVRGEPVVVELPMLSQIESLAFVGDFAFVVAEGRSARILSLGPIGSLVLPRIGAM